MVILLQIMLCCSWKDCLLRVAETDYQKELSVSTNRCVLFSGPALPVVALKMQSVSSCLFIFPDTAFSGPWGYVH